MSNTSAPNEIRDTAFGGICPNQPTTNTHRMGMMKPYHRIARRIRYHGYRAAAGPPRPSPTFG
jgi:hypothetical protein